jgi:MFS family permease
MSAPAQANSQTGQPVKSRLSPELIIAAGCLVGIITFGPRSALGQFQLPILGDIKSLDVSTFSFAMALQYLFWGIGGPVTGALADKYGTGRIMAIGCVVYAIALVLMVYSRDPLTFILTQGVLFGLALSFASFNMIIGAFQKMLPPEWRSFAFGVGTAAGSFGQFLFSPLAGGMIQNIGWQNTAFLFAGIVLTAIPVALALNPMVRAKTPAPAQPVVPVPVLPEQTFREALKEAFSHKSYVFLVLGFFTCGFQLSFVTIHFQRFVVESGIRPEIGYWAFGMVGLCNIIGSMLSGWFSGFMPKRYVLSFIYFARSMVTLLFIIVMPLTPFSVFAFAILTGLLWLSTVPPTSGLIGVMFGSRYFSTLYGFAFLNHQIGGFLGLVLAGWLREATGSFLIVWWLSIGFGIFSAIINLPIVEKPVRSHQPIPA